MEEVLSHIAGSPVHVTFVPHLLPISRGMLSTVYATLKHDAGPEAVAQCFESHYGRKPFIRIRGNGAVPDTLHVRGTNFCDIGFVIDKETGRIILMSAIDNLVKGASGQAVQNMNLMCKLDETTGLTGVPYPI